MRRACEDYAALSSKFSNVLRYASNARRVVPLQRALRALHVDAQLLDQRYRAVGVCVCVCRVGVCMCLRVCGFMWSCRTDSSEQWAACLVQCAVA